MVTHLTTTLPVAGTVFGTGARFLVSSETAQTHRQPDLNGLATLLMEDPSAETLRGLHTLINGGGHIADTRLAFEKALFNSKPFDLKSKKAAARLKLLEIKFDRFRRDPKDISPAEKLEYVKLATDFFEQEKFDLSDPQRRDWLNLAYDLIQLRQFLKVAFEKTLQKFDGMYPALLTHFLCRELGDNPVGGSCHLMTTLAAHLGRRIGLPLQAYYSEGHVDLFVNKGKGFIYGSILDGSIFFPRNFYSFFHLAPEKPDPQDFTFLVFCLTNNILDAQMKIFEGARRLYNLGVEMWEVMENESWTYYDYMMNLSIKARYPEEVRSHFENSLKLFPDNFSALLLYFSFLFDKLKKFEEAEKILEKIDSLVKHRQELGAIAEIEPALLQRLATSRKHVDLLTRNGIKTRSGKPLHPEVG